MMPAPSITIRPTAQLAPGLMADPAYGRPGPGLLRPDPSRRVPASFMSDGIRLVGHLYRPPGLAASARTPGVVMCGPISSVKEMTLPHYAERLSAAGYTVLTFDPRSLGESDAAPGRPRAHYDPAEVIRDYGNAVSHMLTRLDVDPLRVAAVGVCMGGGYTVSLAARDTRLRAAVSIAGGYDCGLYFARWFGPEGFAKYMGRINGLLQREYETGEVAYVPTIATGLTDDVPVAVMPFPAAYAFYDRTSRLDAPNWPRQLTAASLPAWFAYVGQAHAPMVGPTPMLVVHGTQDIELPPESAMAAYDALVGPKQFTWIESHNHFEFYDQDPWVSQAAAAAVSWLDHHLGAGLDRVAA